MPAYSSELGSHTKPQAAGGPLHKQELAVFVV
jgi:hypothetical protein